MLLGAFALFFLGTQQAIPPPDAERSDPRRTETREGVMEDPREPALTPLGAPLPPEPSGLLREVARVLPDPTAAPPAETYVLENDYIRVVFTTRGGAIQSVALKKYPAVQNEEAPYILDAPDAAPALSLALGSQGGMLREYAPAYQLRSVGHGEIVFSRTEEGDGLELERVYRLSESTEGPNPYIITHTTRIRNLSDQAFALSNLFINVGAAAPTEADRLGQYLNAGYFDGRRVRFISATKFSPSSGFLGIGARGATDSVTERAPMAWASVKNQFFASILTPQVPGNGLFIVPVVFGKDKHGLPRQGITANMEMALPAIPAHGDATFEAEYYVGPKEYPRLAQMRLQQDLVMQYPSGFFGWVGFICKLLMHSLVGIHSLVGNWGLSIILMTLIIRVAFWPLTAKAARSAKQMAKIQGPIKELREKYKDDPQKLQKKTLELFQEHKINPLAGCLPLLIQMPIFFALFFMLRSASELRFADFLWIRDLSLPDTVAYLKGFPFNPLPIVMAVTMYLQMRMTPSPSMDSTQQKILRMMPFIFLFFCYNFSSGLVLYWTVSNLFSIGQQVVTNRSKDPEPAATPTPAKPPSTAPSASAGSAKPRKPTRKHRS